MLGGGEVTSGTLSPWLGIGIGMAYVPAARAARRVRELEIDVRGKHASARRQACKPLYRKGLIMAEAATPMICGTTPSTTGCGSTAMRGGHFGITWCAQDTLGEVVFFEPPAVGTS